MGFAVARADAPGGREADAERLAAVVEGADVRKAEGAPHEGRQDNYRM